MKVLYKIIFVEFCLLLVIFPIENFRIHADSVIFPAFEIILLYYFASLYSLNLLFLFLIGIFFDQLYSMPLGTNSLVLVTAHIILTFCRKFFSARTYLTNLLFFCSYYLFILHFRALLMISKGLEIQGYWTMIFQYLTTICSYSLLRIPLDNTLEYFKTHAKQKNIT
jgi:hypothetical protein